MPVVYDNLPSGMAVSRVCYHLAMSNESDRPEAAVAADRLAERLALEPREGRLRQFAEALRLAKEWKARADELAQQLRDEGFSWTEIARAAGVTQQSAHQRWSIDAKRARTKRRQERRQAGSEE